jgi:deoxyribodipyrimidine photo-lyase
VVKNTILWFRQDLRLEDNPALAGAMARGGGVIPVYVWSPNEEGAWAPGAASRWWLHQSLEALDASLARTGSRLIVRAGASLDVLQALAVETGADAVFWNRRYEPAAIARETQLKRELPAAGIEARSFNSALLHEPWTIRNRSGGPFQVFTPYWRTCLTAPEDPPNPVPAPRRIPAPTRWPGRGSLESLRLEPRVDWASGIREVWTPGEVGAQRRLRTFIRSGMSGYPVGRNRPDRDGVSRLSPHLHFGEIGPRQVLRAITTHAPNQGSSPPPRSMSGRSGGASLPTTFSTTSRRLPRNRCVRSSARFHGDGIRGACTLGSALAPATGSSMQGWRNSGPPVGCTIGSA